MTSFQKFRLRWNNHTSNFLGSLGSLLNSENYSDVTVCCEGHVWQLHRLVLSASSSHFEHLLNSIPVGLTPAIILDGPSSADVEALIHFIYHGEVSVDQAVLPSLLRTATSLKIKGLADMSTFAQTDDGTQIVRFVASQDDLAVESTLIEDQGPLNLSCHPEKKTDFIKFTNEHFDMKRKHEGDGFVLKGEKIFSGQFSPAPKKMRKISMLEPSSTTTGTQTKSQTEYVIPLSQELHPISFDSVKPQMKAEPIQDTPISEKLAIGTQTTCNYSEVVYMENPSSLPVVLSTSGMPAAPIELSNTNSTIPYRMSSNLTGLTTPIKIIENNSNTTYVRTNNTYKTTEPLKNFDTQEPLKDAVKSSETTFNHKKFSPCTIPNTTPTTRNVFNSTLNGSSSKIIPSEAKHIESVVPVSEYSPTNPAVNSSLVSQIPRLANTIDELKASSPPHVVPTAVQPLNSPVERSSGSPLGKPEEISSPGFKSPTDSSDEQCPEFSSNQSTGSNNEGGSTNSQRATINMRTFKEEWRKQLLVDYDPRTNMSICMLCFTTFKSYDGPRKNTYVKHAKRFHPALDDYSDEERGVIISMYEKYHKYDIDMQKEINKTFRAPNGPGCVLKRANKSAIEATVAHLTPNGISRIHKDMHNQSYDNVSVKEEKTPSPGSPNKPNGDRSPNAQYPETKFNNNEFESQEAVVGESPKTRKMNSVSVSA